MPDDFAPRGLDAAVALHRAGSFINAIELYDELLAAAPEAASVQHLSGLALAQSGRWAEGLVRLRVACALAPDDATLHLGLGEVALAAGAEDEAATHLLAAQARSPGDGRICVALARLRVAQGVAATAKGNRMTAAQAFSAAMRLDPGQADAAANLAALCNVEGHWPQAEALSRAAIAIAPGHVAAWTNLGNTLHHLSRHDEAAEAFGLALAGDDAAMNAATGLGLSLLALGRLDAAVIAQRAAVATNPACPVAHLNLACCLLAVGEFADGWAEFEWRGLVGVPVPAMAGPAWRGEPLYGRRILVQAEGGYGDMLQFARYVPMLLQRGGQVIMQTRAPLRRLFSALPCVEIAGDAPRYDVSVKLLSLPRLFGTMADTIPPPLPLQVGQDQVAAWRARVLDGHVGALVVGLVWSGASRRDEPAQAEMDGRRSMALARLAPLASVAGLRLVSLQEGAAGAQISDAGMPIFDAMAEMADFADTAVLTAACDLVISVDTAMVHLAGNLDVPVWLLDRYDGCWRWGKSGATSPWYPRLLLFRQDSAGDWDGVVARLAASLERHIGDIGKILR
jgi:tetratricopeptide (TPR) repeat protein